MLRKIVLSVADSTPKKGVFEVYSVLSFTILWILKQLLYIINLNKFELNTASPKKPKTSFKNRGYILRNYDKGCLHSLIILMPY